jgi:hypothetical protein
MTEPIQRITNPIVWVLLIAALAAAVASGAQAFASPPDANKACGLLTAAELESALGSKVTDLKQSGVAGAASPTPASPAGASFCSAETPTAKILLRVAKKTGNDSGAEAKGLEIAKKMGAQVDIKTFGPITCSSMIPPKSLEQYGFNTTCSVNKGTEVAAVEVTAKSQKDMISIDKLKPLAEKMAARF